jgi:hypothetical protein
MIIKGNRTKYPFIITALFLLTLCDTGTRCIIGESKSNNIDPSSVERALIIRHILQRERENGGVSYGKGILYLSTENIVDVLATGMVPSDYVVLSPSRIQELGSKKGLFYYLRFSEFRKTKGGIEVRVIRDTFSQGLIGAIYECKRNSGKWVCNSTKGFGIS